MGILVRLVTGAIALWIATLVFEGISIDTDSVPGKIGTLLVVAAIFGLVNALLRPLIKTVGCALYLVTFGLISLVVNGLLFLLTGWIAEQVDLPFRVDDFWPDAILGALLVGVVSWVLEVILDKVLGSDD